MTSSLPLPPYLYEFVAADGRSLYVGKAGAGPQHRLKEHFDNRRSHALEARSIRLVPLPLGLPEFAVLELEQRMIHELRPRANRQHNGRHYDMAWELRVQRTYRRALGLPVDWWSGVRLWWEVLVWRARRAGVALCWHLVVDVCLVVLWLSLRAAHGV